jgi:hypothetical protein
MMFHFYIPEGIRFAAFVAFVARGYIMQFIICVFCCVFVSFLILVCVFAFLPNTQQQRQLNVRPSTIKLHADGNITSKLIEQYSAAGC